MSVLVAVVKDLYDFAVTGVVTLFTRPPKLTPDEVVADAVAHPPHRPSAEEAFKSTAEILQNHNPAPKNTVVYAGSSETPVYQKPTQMFDGVVAHLPYGAMLMLLENKGRWARVVHNETDGWVLREDLVDRAAYVYPHLLIGERHEADDPNTERLRALIRDEYGAAAAGMPLQAEEYVHYRLHRKGLVLPWGDERPRLAGKWHELLRGKTGVHQHVIPKTGDIIEYELSDGQGHLGFVEAVFPDETINISEANYPNAGIYNERVLTGDEWRELKPIFISIT